MTGQGLVQDIVFRGLRARLRLTDADEVLPVLRAVARGWAFDQADADPEAPVFYAISGLPGTRLFHCECRLDDRPSRRFDAVNAVCDAVAVLASALPAERGDLICLHAAGVEIGGRMVIFPNIRKAGKSTLSAALAMAGYRVFSDDVIPVAFGQDGQAFGLAMGMAPRLRLPLQESFGEAFRLWVDQVAGPANRQYQNLAIPDLPVHGTAAPVGAYVILDRQDDPGSARLEGVSPDAAMDALLHQNFTRDRHSGDILQAMAGTLAQRPVFRLTYSRLDEAVACLGAAFGIWPDQGAQALSETREFRLARFDAAKPEVPLDGPRLRQREGTVADRIGDGLYLADPDGLAIHRMDPMATVIWTLLEEPVTPQEIREILAEAFPDADPAQISDDVQRLLRMLRNAGLIVAA